MNEQDYVQTRIDDQIDWYEKKSAFNKTRYQTLKLIVIVLSVSIPLMTGLISDDTFWLKVSVGISGVIIAMIEGIQSLYKFHENWLLYRNASEFLNREKLFYTTRSGPYAAEASLQKLVERVESFTSEENKSWTAITQENKGKGKKT